MEQKKSNMQSGKISAMMTTRTRIIVLIVLAAVMVLAILLCAFSLRNESLRRKSDFGYNGVLQQESIYPIDIDAKKQKERARDTERHGQTFKFQYFSNLYLTFDTPTSITPIIFGNVSSNDCILVFSLVDGAGTTVYRSGGIEPGKYVSQLRLWHAFAPGEHPVKLYVAAYDRETQAYLGAQYSDVTVRIGG